MPPKKSRSLKRKSARKLSRKLSRKPRATSRPKTVKKSSTRLRFGMTSTVTQKVMHRDVLVEMYRKIMNRKDAVEAGIQQMLYWTNLGVQDETAYIYVDLINLCRKCNVITDESEPALPLYVKAKKRGPGFWGPQLGYVQGVWLGTTVDDFADRLSRTKLNWTVYQITDYTNFRKAAQLPDDTVIRVDRHESGGGLWTHAPTEERRVTYDVMDGIGYQISNDPGALYFQVWDSEWNMPNNYCIQVLTEALQ